MPEPTSLFTTPTPPLEHHPKPYVPPLLELLGAWRFSTGETVRSGGRIFLPLDPP